MSRTRRRDPTRAFLQATRQDWEKFELPKRNTKNKHSENQFVKKSFPRDLKNNLLGQDPGFATRNDQLNLKPPKKETGRGRGRGRGRGGRGKAKVDDHDEKTKDAKSKKKLKEEYESGPDWTEEMQEAWDAWTWEEENKWDEYVKTDALASVAAIKKTEKKDKDDRETEKKKQKKRKGKEDDVAQEAAPEKKKKTDKENQEDANVEASPSKPPFPHRQKDQVAAILDFLNKIESFKIPDPHRINSKTKDLIRCHSPNSAEARLMVYWKRPAVGVYMRSESRDIACFSFGAMADNHPFLLRLAASLKIASLMVTCLLAEVVPACV